MRATSCALAISGLDPSGGAGVYADLRAFGAAGVWGCGAVAVMTVQSTSGLRSARPVPTAHLMAQIREIAAHQHVRSVKLGALGSVANVKAVGRWLANEAAGLPVVIDPVMSATRSARGARLLDRSAAGAMLQLVARATLVTPNVPEAQALLGVPVTTVDEAEHAARALVALGARAALVKGGHLSAQRGRRARPDDVVDVLAVGRRTRYLRRTRLAGDVHGTGCVLASLIAGRLAAARTHGDDAIVAAVRWAHRAFTQSRTQPRNIGDGQWVLA